MYVVIYSSCTLWTAVFAVALTRTRLSSKQWMGINLLTFGLIFHGLENYTSGGEASSKVTLEEHTPPCNEHHGSDLERCGYAIE